MGREGRIYYRFVLESVDFDSLEIVFLQIFCAWQRFLRGAILFKGNECFRAHIIVRMGLWSLSKLHLEPQRGRFEVVSISVLVGALRRESLDLYH